MDNLLKEKKVTKSKFIYNVLNQKKDFSLESYNYNFLTDEIHREYGIKPTKNISSHNYDCYAQKIIDTYPDGLILDCGSGKRNEYLANVVNFDIVNYDTTDVIGLGEFLPFIDNSFDAVFSLNVLEHVKDPFSCAQEIARVLKPNGILYCVVPFMSPYHDFPDHFYNMTKEGLANLFKPFLEITKQDVIGSGLPIFSLTWFLNEWVNGLKKTSTRDMFINLKVRDLLNTPTSYLNKDYVTELDENTNYKLAATTALWATKI